MIRALTQTATSSRNIHRAIRKSKVGVHGVHGGVTVERGRTITGARRVRAMLRALPGEAPLRALMAIVEARGDPEAEIRAAVDAFWRRGNDAKAERQFLEQLPEQAKGALGWALSGLEGICGDFSEALGVHVLEWPSRFPPPPGALIGAMASSVVLGEFRVICARVNIEEKGDDDGNSVR